MTNGNILITGATGFIGKSLLKDNFFKNSITISRQNLNKINSIKFDFNSDKDFEKLTKDIDYVIHLAGIADKTSKNISKKDYLHINYKCTKKLALAASKSGVKKFIFISSINVLGEYTKFNQKFSFDSPYNPKNNYAYSKMKAEKALIDISKKTNLDTIIIRCPLVYDTKAKGNLQFLIKILRLKIPLPLASLKNSRSIVSINNLIELIKKCIFYKKPIKLILHICDNKDLSTTDLIYKIANELNIRVIVFKFPIIFLKLIFFMIGKRYLINKIFYSLKVDQFQTKKILGWEPC